MNIFDESTLAVIGKRLIRKQQTVAVAESVTGGLLQFAFSGIMDASKFYQGGITAYNISHKCRLLGVDPLHAMAVNCVSESVAKTMALNVAGLFDSLWGLSITGYASAVPESKHKLFAFYAISFDGQIVADGKMIPETELPGEVQIFYANSMLKTFLTLIGA